MIGIGASFNVQAFLNPMAMMGMGMPFQAMQMMMMMGNMARACCGGMAGMMGGMMPGMMGGMGQMGMGGGMIGSPMNMGGMLPGYMPGFNPMFGGGMFPGSDQLMQNMGMMGNYGMLGMGMMGMPGMAGMMLGGMMGGLIGGAISKGMMGGMMGMGRAQQLHGGMGGLKLQGNEVTTPGGYKISYSGTTVNISGMGKVGGGSFAMAGATPFGSFAMAGQMPGRETTGNTKIWGDPHVDQSNGKTWDWKEKSMSFNLPDGTKITMNAESANGVVKSVDVYNGNEHVHGEGGSFQGSSYDGYMADAMQADGESVFARGNDVGQWYSNPYGMGPEVAQTHARH
jgi:hypothetical protein